MTLLEQARTQFGRYLAAREMLDDAVNVEARTLSTEEAIGRPEFTDLPILRGKEVMIEAQFKGARGHAFTNAPSSWSGTLKEALELPLDNNRNRALLLAIMNAVMRESGLIGETVHCRNEDIGICGDEMMQQLREEFGPARVGIVGYQPGLVKGAIKYFGAENIRATDLLESNLGRVVDGVTIWDGAADTKKLVDQSDFVLATGSTAANGTLDEILSAAKQRNIPVIVFGVTGAAVAHFCSLRRLCLRAS